MIAAAPEIAATVTGVSITRVLYQSGFRLTLHDLLISGQAPAFTPADAAHSAAAPPLRTKSAASPPNLPGWSESPAPARPAQSPPVVPRQLCPAQIFKLL